MGTSSFSSWYVSQNSLHPPKLGVLPVKHNEPLKTIAALRNFQPGLERIIAFTGGSFVAYHEPISTTKADKVVFLFCPVPHTMFNNSICPLATNGAKMKSPSGFRNCCCYFLQLRQSSTSPHCNSPTFTCKHFWNFALQYILINTIYIYIVSWRCL